MLSVLKDLSNRSFASKSEVVAALNAALVTWGGAFSITVTPFVAADLPDVIKVGDLAHMIGRRLLGLPSITYMKRDLTSTSYGSFSSLVAGFEADYNTDPAGGYLYLGFFDTLRAVATRLDEFLVSSMPSWLSEQRLLRPISEVDLDVYRRPASDPRLEHIPWLNGMFDWRLLYRVEGTELVAYQNMSSIAAELTKSIEIATATIIRDEPCLIDIYDYLLVNTYRASKSKYSYALSKQAYAAADGSYSVSDGHESVINRLLSLRHSEGVYPIMFM